MRRRVHHAQHGNLILLTEHVQRVGRHGAAGDDDGLGVKGIQKGGVLPGVFDNGLLGAAAVGHPSGVTKVDDVLSGQQAAQLPHSGQSAQTRVKHANRSFIHKKTS